MKFCTRCGKKQEKEAQICPNCKNKFTKQNLGVPIKKRKNEILKINSADNELVNSITDDKKSNLYNFFYRTHFGKSILTTIYSVAWCLIFFLSASTFDFGLTTLYINIAAILVIVTSVFTPVIVVHHKINKSPVKKTRAVLIDKIRRIEDVVVTRLRYFKSETSTKQLVRQCFVFELPNGSKIFIPCAVKDMSVGGIYDMFAIGDEGTLIYQEYKFDLKLLDFEIDNFKYEKPKLSLYDKLYNTRNGRLTLQISSILAVPILSALFLILFYPQKNSDFFLPFLLAFAIPAGVYFIPDLIVNKILDSSPEKHKYVKRKQVVVRILGFGNSAIADEDIDRAVIIVEMPDKSRKSFKLDSRQILKSLKVNDVGILIYNQWKNQIKSVVFVKVDSKKLKRIKGDLNEILPKLPL